MFSSRNSTVFVSVKGIGRYRQSPFQEVKRKQIAKVFEGTRKERFRTSAGAFVVSFRVVSWKRTQQKIMCSFKIDPYQYIRILPNTIVLSARLWGINPTNFCSYSPDPCTEVYCFILKFNISKQFTGIGLLEPVRSEKFQATHTKQC